jgi:hypothetical protein
MWAIEQLWIGGVTGPTQCQVQPHTRSGVDAMQITETGTAKHSAFSRLFVVIVTPPSPSPSAAHSVFLSETRRDT